MNTKRERALQSAIRKVRKETRKWWPNTIYGYLTPIEMYALHNAGAEIKNSGWTLDRVKQAIKNGESGNHLICFELKSRKNHELFNIGELMERHSKGAL